MRSKESNICEKGGKAIVYKPSSIPGRAPPVRGAWKVRGLRLKKAIPSPRGGDTGKREVKAGCICWWSFPKGGASV